MATTAHMPAVLPVLPIRNTVLFPAISMPLVVGRGRSIRALEEAEGADNLIIIVAQRLLTAGDPDPGDLYQVGTLCKIESVVSSEAGAKQIVVTGLSRYRLAEFTPDPRGFLSTRGEPVADIHSGDPIRNEALFNNLKELTREILELLPGSMEPLIRLVEQVDDSGYLTNVCAAYLNLTLTQKQELLETVLVEQRMEMLLSYMRKEREVLNVQREIRDKMSERINKAQREALLREQLRTIRSELGEAAEEETADDLQQKIREAQLPEDAMKQAQDELNRIKNLPSASAEYHVIRTYLEWLASLPWTKRTESRIDVPRARVILDEDHYGLENVKRRITQFLSVAKLKNDLHGPILCLVGPPGVGKTSVGASIARALGRKFIRTSLGGVRDEAEIRGHRRTYVGAMPGRIVQSIKRVGTKNPLMMLDEIDKLRADFHGDPSAAMLEVLDPEQNKSFTDHYLDVPFDLSDVFFICTANVIDPIPPALRDRMEIIEMNGYTSQEKLHIAKRYLIPRLLQEHGIKPEWISLPEETIERIASHYTREAGVRELNRKIAALFRAVAEEVILHGPTTQISLAPDQLRKFLGPERFFPELAERVIKPGVTTGLAWTPQGGDLLFVEATAMPGRGNLTLTGQLGDVMKESAQIALSIARTSSAGFDYRSFDFSTHDIHVHVPAGAIPKDGPSAGVTILVSLVSLLLGRSVESKIGMTGEITLRGAILPVGGIKEKVIAAARGGLSTVILPKKNEQDLVDVPQDARNQLKFVFVETVDEVLKEALPDSHVEEATVSAA
ncbi:MAG: endopeptidase La [Bdellovibrionales bacterium RIFOXYC1_FULL_54_43]|nr:MAG: endopeptidase La [Bdellovibrionales bacterium RIFOXYC1_FULL_54_43]OFZ81482.1 MAG: endopeptidase La [Bdellovibrionales bacterium RIFOXYD1_FULL_55_31]